MVSPFDMAGMDPIVVAIIIAVLGMAGYVAYLFVMCLPMSRTGYLVCCIVSFIVVMTILGWGLHHLVYEIDMWLALPVIAIGLLASWLIDRFEYRQGKLHLDPESKFDRWYAKFLPKAPTEDHQRGASEFHTRLDPPE